MSGLLIKDSKLLKEKVKKVRQLILKMLFHAGSGHLGGSMSSAEIVTVLYFSFLNITPENHKTRKKDKFILSKGHAAPVLYANLALKGFFPISDLDGLRKFDSHLQGHPAMHKTPGVDASTGSLGQGISIAVGYALADKMDKLDSRTYSLLGDGELQEGMVWEALMSASQYNLDNLTIFIDNNNLQIDGKIEDVMSVYPIVDKLEAFGFDVFEINGHSVEDLLEIIPKANATKKPSAIVCKTIKGKCVSFAENQAKWHGMAPTEDEYKQALNELEECGK